ncbi:MAG: DnaJ domain-containing protein [Blautia sp.]
MKDYYQILGVKRNAGLSEIKKAYRILAKKYHPDSSGGDEEVKRKFQEITEAYRVLSDEKARKQYNSWGHAAYTEQSRRHTGEPAGEDGHCGACQRRNPRPKEEGPPPYSLRAAVHMVYGELLTGAEKEAEVRYKENCPHCKGTVGHGLEDQEEKCPFCKGRGYLERSRKVRVRIPERSYDGCFYHLEDVLCEGQEEVLQKNIVIIVLVDDDPGYIRQGYHLYSSKLVDFADLVLGATIEIDTVEGKQEYAVAPGTQNGARIRLAGKGLWMPPKIGKRGDLYVTLQVEIPQTLTKEQRQALEAYRRAMKNGSKPG